MTSGRQMWLEEHGDEPWDDRPTPAELADEEDPDRTELGDYYEVEGHSAYIDKHGQVTVWAFGTWHDNDGYTEKAPAIGEPLCTVQVVSHAEALTRLPELGWKPTTDWITYLDQTFVLVEPIQHH